MAFGEKYTKDLVRSASAINSQKETLLTIYYTWNLVFRINFTDRERYDY